MSSGPLMSAQEVAAMFGVSLRTIYRWKAEGGGPPALKVGRHLRYRPDDVERWLERQANAEVVQ